MRTYPLRQRYNPVFQFRLAKKTRRIFTVSSRTTKAVKGRRSKPTMLATDWMIDLDPDAGDEGGEIIYSGPAPAVFCAKRSATGAELRRYIRISAG